MGQFRPQGYHIHNLSIINSNYYNSICRNLCTNLLWIYYLYIYICTYSKNICTKYVLYTITVSLCIESIVQIVQISPASDAYNLFACNHGNLFCPDIPVSTTDFAHDDDVPLAAVLLCPLCHCLLEEGVKAQYLHQGLPSQHQCEDVSGNCLDPNSPSIHLLPRFEMFKTIMTQECRIIIFLARPSVEKTPMSPRSSV